MLLAFIQLKQMAKLKKDPEPGKVGYYVFYYYFHRFWRYCAITMNIHPCKVILFFQPSITGWFGHAINLHSIIWSIKKRSVRWWYELFIFRRLTPMYMIILMIYTCLTTYLGDGPMWPKQIESAQNCRESWWTNLLYVNNLVLVDKQVREKNRKINVQRQNDFDALRLILMWLYSQVCSKIWWAITSSF